MSTSIWPLVIPWLMLAGSNVFMTFAWYGHLKHRALGPAANHIWSVG